MFSTVGVLCVIIVAKGTLRHFRDVKDIITLYEIDYSVNSSLWTMESIARLTNR